MKIITNRIIPFPGFKAVNICGVLFVRTGCSMSERDLRHEEIHSRQWAELLVAGFLLWYVIEWLIRVLFTCDRFSHRAYRSISLEREAYLNEADPGYLTSRRHFSFTKYI